MTTNEWEDTMGLTREIGEFVAGMRFERVPAGAVETVARGFTDCVGVMLAGLAEPVASDRRKVGRPPRPGRAPRRIRRRPASLRPISR